MMVEQRCSQGVAGPPGHGGSSSSPLGYLPTTAGLWGTVQGVEQPLMVTVLPKTSAFLSRHTVDVSAQSRGGNGTGLGGRWKQTA